MDNENDLPVKLKYPELYQLFGAYFHQDFDLEYSTAEEAITDYVKGRPKILIEASIKEIEAILQDKTIKNLDDIILNGLGSYWDHRVNNYTAKEWLLKIKKQLQTAIYLAPNINTKDTRRILKREKLQPAKIRR